jgi:hypothetical protein
MGELHDNETGFSVVMVVMALVIVLLIAAVGWLVYDNHHKTAAVTITSAKTNPSQKAVSTTQPSVSPAAPTPAPNPTANWTPYSSPDGKFSVRYPTTWAQTPPQDDCEDGSILDLGPNSQSMQSCDYQMYVYSQPGNQVATDTPTDDYAAPENWYANVVTAPVAVDGVTGTRSTATTTYNYPGHEFYPGTKLIRYVFYTNGMTYSAEYLQNPEFPQDVSSDFDLMITKTLKFLS